MPITIDPSLPDDVQVLLKAAFHMCHKAEDLGHGYRVPKREFERVRSKVRILTTPKGEEG